MNLAFLCGGYPPAFDAIGQYTRELGRELAAQGHRVSVLTGGTRREADGPLAVRGVFDPARPATLRALPGAVEEGTDWLIVQHNPFSFGPRGFCPQLPAALAAVRRKSRARVAVMLHETFVPPWPWKFAVMRLWQLPQFFLLCRLADRLFISSERWREQVRRVPGAREPIMLPVGSNLPLSPLGKEEARRALGIGEGEFVLGIFGNAHPSRLLHWAGAAARAIHAQGPGVSVLYVGKDGAAAAEACRGVPFRDEGALPDGEAAARLRAMDCLVAPFEDGISARRSSILAGLRHQLPVLTTSRGWSERFLLENPLVFASPMSGGPEAFTALAQTMREACRALPVFDFETSPFAWPVMAQTLVAALC